MKSSIFANGEISPATNIEAEGLILAADGGARRCLELGICPDVVIGDFDSLTPGELASLEASGATTIRHPADKDETDLELALGYALQHGADEIALYGLLGGRWDMSIANLLLLAAPRYAGIKLRVVVDGRAEIFILRGGETLALRGQPGDTVSVIPLGGAASGVSYQGLQWPLENAALPFSTPRGVSNAMSGEEARIELEEGVLLVLAYNCPKSKLTNSFHQ